MTDEADVQRALEEMAQQLEASKGLYPEAASKDTELKLVRDVISEEDTARMRKTGYLWPEEIGKPKIPLRTWETLAVYADEEGLDMVAAYLRNKGSVLPATSLSRKGFLVQLPGTVRRKSLASGAPKESKTTTLFGKEKTMKEGVEFD